MNIRTDKELTMFEALLPLLTLILLLVGSAVAMRVTAVTSELLIAALICAAVVAGFIAVRHGSSWDAIQRSAGDKIGAVLPALLILLVIGMLIASWMFSGTIPFLVYWGIRIVQPQYLVLTAFLATAVMSLATGTSWGSAGTIGVALMGVAVAIDAPLAATAGAVLSGAYFGDKMSPLSDSTNICSMAAGAPLYPHIRHLLYTATPSVILCLIVYTFFVPEVAGGAPGLPDSARTMLREIDAAFRLHWTALIPPAVVIAGIVRKVAPTLAIMLSSFVALLIGVVVQGFSGADAMISAIGGFRATMLTAEAQWDRAFLTLVERGGLYSMATTFVVIISAFMLAAAMDVSGALNLMIERMLASVRSVFGVIAASMAAGAMMIALTSHGGVTGLVIGGLFQRAYRERGLAPENLGRSLEDSITITEPLMPWTVSAIFMATTTGVATIAYAPWAVFCYGGPMFSLMWAALYRKTGGFGIKPL
jgi:NhaC family Na+:H+ antiporter